MRQPGDQAFQPARKGPGHVDVRPGTRGAGKNEIMGMMDPRFPRRAQAVHPLRRVRIQALGQLIETGGKGGQFGAHEEQGTLKVLQDAGHLGFNPGGPGQAQGANGLIHRAQGLDADGILAHMFTRIEPGAAPVPGSSGYACAAHGAHSPRFPTRRQMPTLPAGRAHPSIPAIFSLPPSSLNGI